MKRRSKSVSVPVKRGHIRKSFLNSVCPFRILDERVTWGEFIANYIKAGFDVACFYTFYIFMVIAAESLGVID